MNVLLLFEPLEHSRPGPNHQEVFLLLADGSIYKANREAADNLKPWRFPGIAGEKPREVYPVAWAPVPFVGQADIQDMFVRRKAR